MPLAFLLSAVLALQLALPALGAPAAQRTGDDAEVAASDPFMTIARIQYGGGGDWYAGPSSLPNLLRAIRERTGLPVAADPVTVRLTDPDLRNYPFLFLTGHGDFRFTEEEIDSLRRYLLSGGFIHADDCYGLDEHFRREIARVFPDKDLVPIPNDHEIYNTFYTLPEGLPKIHEHDGLPPQGFGIFHEGRMIVYYTYESDIHDGWEDAEVHGNPPELREEAFRMGVNIFYYVLAQSVR